MSHSCTRKDSLSEIESLQRAICLSNKMERIWCERWNNHRGPNDDAFKMYMLSECIGIYLQEHCEHMGLDHKSHIGKPPSIAGEAFLDKIWDSEINDWRKGGGEDGR